MSWRVLRLHSASRPPGCSSRCNQLRAPPTTPYVLTFLHLLDESCPLAWCCLKEVPVKMEDKLKIKGTVARKMMLSLLFCLSSLLFAFSLFFFPESNVLFTKASGILSTFKNNLSIFSKSLRSSREDCRVYTQVWHPWSLVLGNSLAEYEMMSSCKASLAWSTAIKHTAVNPISSLTKLMSYFY